MTDARSLSKERTDVVCGHKSDVGLRRRIRGTSKRNNVIPHADAKEGENKNLPGKIPTTTCLFYRLREFTGYLNEQQGVLQDIRTLYPADTSWRIWQGPSSLVVSKRHPPGLLQCLD
ncbi:uncharacterized protein LOC107272882 [Cephus cinctus]|uniref:Uncharacterized protein LOC107272882 n=1 Tax=Cephus cinctus TaxID=211228 RepID=A0AAJ7W649_CEPCN|nr:uncharacterized protein LOC107272882 [Cephus cinctus]